MHHRYGRHGPRAWLRQRMRRYARSSVISDLVASPPVVPATIIHVSVPTTTERIIFIIMPDGNTYEARESQEAMKVEVSALPPSLPDSRLIGPSQDERTRNYTQIRNSAVFEANTYYDGVIQNVLDRGAEWPLDETVRREASVKANVTLRPFVNTSPDLDLEAAKQFYIDTYLETYRARYEKDTGNGTLPNQEAKEVKELAQRDARKDKRDEVELEEPELTYHAAIAIEYHFGYRARAGSGYLTYIMGHIPHYKQAYQACREEIDRPQRSSPFPGGWQSGRSSQLRESV